MQQPTAELSGRKEEITMATDRKSLPAAAYTVGLVYIKPLEMYAITTMLDEEHERVPLQHGDANSYTLGRIGAHNVAIVGLPRGAQGKVKTADIAARIRLTFPNMTIGLLVGIGGGKSRLPDHDVRLGDVVVAAPEIGPAVVQYDLGKETGHGFEYNVLRTLDKPPPQLLQVVNVVEDRIMRQRRGDVSFFTTHLLRFQEYDYMKDKYQRPSTEDRLFAANFDHESGSNCLTHEKQYEEERPNRHPPGAVKVHYSTILSGDQVMKSAVKRDELSDKFYQALCFEVEAAGLMDSFPCLVVRGICDYSDTHKSKVWQEYAAATAAAYMREILLCMEKRTVQELGRLTLKVVEEKKHSGGGGGGVHQQFSGNSFLGVNNSGFIGNSSNGR